MNPLRRWMLHPLTSRHNPLTRLARICILSALITAVVVAVSEFLDVKKINSADKAMLAELILVVDGKAKMVEKVGNYAVEYEIHKTLYEVK